MSRQFCIMTTGRSGSTELINCLAAFDDVAVPSKDIECLDNELVHPRTWERNSQQYAALCGPIADKNELIAAFFAHNRHRPYAGFKSMPNRHQNYDDFVDRDDVQFIVLRRRDIASMAASFYMAKRTGSWRRSGEPQAYRWQFRRDDAQEVVSNLQYLLASEQQLNRISNAITLTYEDLCDPNFSHSRLDEFFGRSVKLANPKPPTSAASYVVNWTVFQDFVNRMYRQLQLGPGARP